MIKLSPIPTAQEVQAAIDYLKEQIKVQNQPAQILGYRRFVGVLAQADTDPPEIMESIVNEVNLTNGDFRYGTTGVYVIDRPDLMTGLWNQAGVGVIGSNDDRAMWELYPYDNTNPIYLVTYRIELTGDMTLQDELLRGCLVEFRFPL